MGSQADAKDGDELRRAALAVRNVGWFGAYIVGRAEWDKMVDELIVAAQQEVLCASTS